MTTCRRGLRAILAAVCLVGLVGVVAGASGVGVLTEGDAQTEPAEVTANGTIAVQDESISYLSPPPASVGRETHYSTGLDVSTAVAADVQRLRGDYTLLAFDKQRTALDSNEQQREFFNRTADRISERIESLDANHAAIIAAYNDGDLSTGGFLREYLRTEIAATQQREFAEYVDLFQVEETVPRAVDSEIVMLPDPVIADFETAARRGTGGNVIYLQTAEESVVLARAGPEFLRQATLRDERDPSLPDQFAGEDLITAVNDRMNELYPWARVVGFQSERGALYEVELDHENTDIDVLLDGGTTNVYHEIQRVDAPSVAAASTVTNSSGELGVTVETTQPSGPMQVSIVDESSGEPVSGMVYVDGNRVGQTGGDGQRWVVQPMGAFAVTVETPAGESVTVSGP